MPLLAALRATWAAAHLWVMAGAAFPAFVATILAQADPAGAGGIFAGGVTAAVVAVLTASLLHNRKENQRTDRNRDLSVLDARKERDDAREQLRVELARVDAEWAADRARLERRCEQADRRAEEADARADEYLRRMREMERWINPTS